MGSGSNGKTVMMSLLKRAFGEYFKDLPHQVITQVQKDSEAPSPQLACTQGCRLCNTAEPSKSGTIQTSRLKLLAGNERLTIRQLYKTPADVHVRFKLLMSVNDVPDLSSSGNSEARSRASHPPRRFPAHPHRPGRPRPRQPTSIATTAQSPGPPRGDRRPGGQGVELQMAPAV